MMPTVCSAPAFSVHLNIPPKVVDALGQNKTVQDGISHNSKGMRRNSEQIKTLKNNVLVPFSGTIS